MPDPATRLPLPTLPPPPERPPFPVVAAVAPVVLSVAIWLLTGSAFALLFAALGPVVAVANVLDGRRRNRAARRRALARFDGELDELDAAVASAQLEHRSALERAVLDERDELDALRVVGAWREAGDGARAPACLGIATLDSGVAVTGDAREDLDEPRLARIRSLRADASRLAAAPVVVDIARGAGLTGPELATRALARALLLDALATASPASSVVRAPPGEDWVRALPHAVEFVDRRSFGVRRDDGEWCIAWAPTVGGLEGPFPTIVSLGGSVVTAEHGALDDVEPRAVPRGEARRRADRLAGLARRHGVPRASALPERVELGALLDAAAAPGSEPTLAVPVGAAAEGVVELDLVRDGPHALVAGTTGSGKSEALIAWVLALAARCPPSRLAVLLVDFKGGATFAPLAGLPHLAGVVTDLDARRARRAMTGLRAELRRRERVLAAAGVRSIDELAPGELARLVVVVDEYAALVAEHPEVHDTVADLAARGRSLGLHLVLCTQRPSGVVRDAVLANVTLRLALRTTDAAESRAVIGTDAAARLPIEPRGRAIVQDGRATRVVQLAIAAPGDVDRARTVARDARDGRPGSVPPGPVQPWSDPLPVRLARAELPALEGAGRSLGFGLADRPDEQRHEPASWEPGRHGALLVLGAARSGRSTALATLVEAARDGGTSPLVLPSTPADAWTALDGVLARLGSPDAPGLVVVDDADDLVARCSPEHAAGLVERLERLVRRAPGAGVGVALSAVRPGGALHPLAALLEARLVLRQPSREDHVLAGLDGREFRPDAPPGAGSWRALEVQVAEPEGVAADVLAGAVRAAPVPVVALDRSSAVVTGRPAVVARDWRRGGVRIRVLGEDAEPDAAEFGSGPLVVVGDPDAWQAAWGLLAAVRRRVPMLVAPDVSSAELRAISRCRDVPPPLDPAEPGEWWLVADGAVRRVRVRAP